MDWSYRIPIRTSSAGHPEANADRHTIPAKTLDEIVDRSRDEGISYEEARAAVLWGRDRNRRDVEDAVRRGDYAETAPRPDTTAAHDQRGPAGSGELSPEPGLSAAVLDEARGAANDAVARGDDQALAVALGRMGVPAEDDLAMLAGALLALPEDRQRSLLDSMEVINAAQGAQVEVLARQQTNRGGAAAAAVIARSALTPPTHRPAVGCSAGNDPRPRTNAATDVSRGVAATTPAVSQGRDEGGRRR